MVLKRPAALCAVAGILLLCACSETVVKDTPDGTESVAQPDTANNPEVLAIPSSPEGDNSDEQASSMVDSPIIADLDPKLSAPAVMVDEAISSEAESDNPTDLPTTEPADTTASNNQTAGGIQATTPSAGTDSQVDADADVDAEPPASENSDTSTTPGTSGTLSASPDTSAMDVTDTTDEETQIIQTQASEPATGIFGEPGMVVDCQGKVPCRWSSANGDFSVTVGNADNISTRNGLSVQFTVSTSHDTELSIGRAERAIDGAGIYFDASEYRLGDSNGITAQKIEAGSLLVGAVGFNQATESNTVSQWSITFIDNGVMRNASFSNIPVGTVTRQLANCEERLPCVWVSPSQDVTITLQSVGGLTAANRLTVNFSIVSSTDTDVAVDAGATAVGIDGTQFKARTHTLGSLSDYQKISSPVRSGAMMPGSIHFYRTATSPSALQDLSLIIYKDKPAPRWNPRFTAVPIL